MSRIKGLPLLLLFASCLLFGAREARACSCLRTATVLDEFEWAEEVVVVRVVALKKRAEKAAGQPPAAAGDKSAAEAADDEYARYGFGGILATETVVEKVYKGGLEAGASMTFAQGGGGDCIWTFSEDDVGSRYLFYLKRSEKSTLWFAGTCGRSQGFEHAHDDLLFLNNLDKVRGKTRLSGTLRFAEAGAPPAAGRKVRITSPAGKTRAVTTDEHGVYEVYDLPAGTYAIETDAPQGWKVGGFWPRGGEAGPPSRKMSAVLAEKRHAGLDINFDIDNAIRGKVYDTMGRPLDDVCLKLLPAEGQPPRYFFKLDCTKNGGAFEIDQIPPGRYVIVLNEEGKVTSREPFGTFYHPNVTRREDATVFQVGAGDFIENVHIYAPKTVETVTVEGVLLYADGKPVADEWVEFHAAGKQQEDASDARAKTDAKGRFAIRILKGQTGNLSGGMFVYLGQFENCPKLEAAIKQTGSTTAELNTPHAAIRADADLRGVELRYPFPGCKKKRE